jgi:hypothetical protein
MIPKPEKILRTSLKIEDVITFDREAYIKKNRNQIHARIIIDFLNGLTSEKSDFNTDLNKFLISNPINLEVLTLILSDFILMDDMVKKKLLSNCNTINAKSDRKEKPSKNQLLEFKTEYEIQYEYKHGVETCRGWIKAATNHYGIDAKTLKIIIK